MSPVLASESQVYTQHVKLGSLFFLSPSLPRLNPAMTANVLDR